MIADERLAGWLLAVAVGLLWLGGQILWVGGLPRLFRRRPEPGSGPTTKPGSAQAFLIFWLDQYSWIGTTLCSLGLLLALLSLPPLVPR